MESATLGTPSQSVPIGQWPAPPLATLPCTSAVNVLHSSPLLQSGLPLPAVQSVAPDNAISAQAVLLAP